MSLFYTATKTFFRIFHTLWNRLEVRGRENVPSSPIIVASNHASNIDPPLIGGIFRRQLRYLAKEELFRGVLGRCISALGAIPVRREDSQRAGVVMKMLLDRLALGESILVFPEGARSRDGRIQPLEGGAAFLSVRSGVPILPTYIFGSFRVCPPGKTLPRPAKLIVAFGRPISPDGEGSVKERRERVQDELTRALLEMESEMEGAAGA